MRLELRRTRENPEIANAIFDGYLCPAEYLLYGPTPYAEVIGVARDLQTTARRSGALRAAAFASALIGEAALLSGDLELAAAELTEASDLHRDLGSAAGEAHSLQRLAEVRVAEGDDAAAMRLLQQALPLARSSMIAKHLLQRIFGTMILAAPDPLEARAIVDRAESTLGWDDACLFCSIMLSVPASIACVRAGDLDERPAPPGDRRAVGAAVAGHVVGGGDRRGAGRGRGGAAATPRRRGSGCSRRPSSSNGPASRSTPNAAAAPWPSTDAPDFGCKTGSLATTSMTKTRQPGFSLQNWFSGDHIHNQNLNGRQCEAGSCVGRRIHLAGEHTESLAGYMESAVRSGRRVARSIGAP